MNNYSNKPSGGFRTSFNGATRTFGGSSRTSSNSSAGSSSRPNGGFRSGGFRSGSTSGGFRSSGTGFKSQGGFRGGFRGNRGGRGASQGNKIHFSNYVKAAAPVAEQEVYTSTNTFETFGLRPEIVKNITSHGYTTPTPIQDQALPYILSGRDVVGIANTGTGKTAVFLLPIIQKILGNRQEKALIIVPTRELAIQIQDELKAFTPNLWISSTLVIGGASMYRQQSDLKRHPSIVIATPGRLLDLTKQHSINLNVFTTIVLDEVDRMVDIGFINDIKYIVSMLPTPRQSLFFSATVSNEIKAILAAFAPDPVTVSVQKSQTASGVHQDVIHVHTKEEKFDKLVELLKQPDFKKVIVFGRTKYGVERLAVQLTKVGIFADSIHGNKSLNQRQRALTMFKSDRIQALIATDVAARGIDIDDVSHVINYDEPDNYDTYIHRIGRTGRANKQGYALTFVGA